MSTQRTPLLAIVILLLSSHCARTNASRFVAGAEFLATEPPQNAIWLDQLDVSGVEQEWGSPAAGKSVDGNPITLAGQQFPRGLGTHAYSEAQVDLGGQACSFRAIVGIDDEVGDHGAVRFSVWLDGRKAWQSRAITGGSHPQLVEIDLRGRNELTLIVSAVDDEINYAHADWAGAMIVMEPDAIQMPRMNAQREPRLPEIWRPPSAGQLSAPPPRINTPRIVGSTPGREFLFRIPASGPAAMEFEADNLPPGLSLDRVSGIISGQITRPGRYVVDLSVHAPVGSATSTLTIIAAPHSLALTPPMGWNSWNVWGTSVDDAKVRAAADAMVSSGLAAAGYQYVNIDDAWEGQRDGQGRILPNEKFPDMKALADYVHSRGLKLGIYSSPGPKTCAEYEGSYEHEVMDAQTYAEWGIDLLKYDWCSYNQIAPNESRRELKKPYEVMREALDASGRDIVYSICQYGKGKVWEWGADVGGNYWRTTKDITDTWMSVSYIGFSQHPRAKYARPGHWNDPDMLVVGRLGWGPNIRPTRLTPNQQQTHMTLWAMLAAPLLIGCDLSQLDEFTLALLANPEVIEVNQDPLGKQARRVKKTGLFYRGPTADRCEVWARPLCDGSTAVALFNRGRRDTTMTIKWKTLGLSGPQQVRDLWRRCDLGVFDKGFSASVPTHGTVMIRCKQKD